MQYSQIKQRFTFALLCSVALIAVCLFDQTNADASVATLVQKLRKSTTEAESKPHSMRFATAPTETGTTTQSNPQELSDGVATTKTRDGTYVSVPATPTVGHPDEVTVSSNSNGNNIAIRNTNNVVLSGGMMMPNMMPGYGPIAQQPQGGQITSPLNGKQDLREQADEQKNKQDSADKAAEETRKKTQIQLDAKFIPFGGDYLDPSFYVFKNSMCFLTGMVRGGEGLVGKLPEACRPKARLVFSVMKTNKPARVDVLADGRIYTIVGGGGDGWLSLAGISFSIDTNPELVLSSGWENYGGDYRTNSLTRESRICMLSGLLKGSNWGTMGRVNSDCIPDAPLIFSVNNHDGVTRMDIQTNGYFNYAGGSANNGWVSLDGMVFTKTGGMPLSLMNNWVNYGGFRPAKYERVGDMCIISGLIRNTGDWQTLITTLPAECRPMKRLAFGGNVHTSSARVDVLPDGALVYVTGKGSWDWLSLSNIHFQVTG